MGKEVDALIDYVKEEDKTELYSFISKLSKEDGLSKDQFDTPDKLDAFLAQGVNLCCKDMGNNGKLFAFCNGYPSPLCRSNNPILHAG